MEAIGGGVFPEDGVGAVDGGSSEGLPAGVDALMDLCAVVCDGDGAAAVDGDDVEAGG